MLISLALFQYALLRSYHVFFVIKKQILSLMSHLMLQVVMK